MDAGDCRHVGGGVMIPPECSAGEDGRCFYSGRRHSLCRGEMKGGVESTQGEGDMKGGTKVL